MLQQGKVRFDIKLKHILDELIEKENDYIKMLEVGIKNYLKPIELDSNLIDVPKEIQNQKFKLFGSIEDIYRLHQNQIYPQLLKCNYDIQSIAKLFITLIKEDSFYLYIVYAINFKQAERLLLCHSQFFNLLKRICNDELGVQNFVIQPIQKISRYALYLEQMINILSREMHENKETLAFLCVATKNVERLLNRLNEALTINDIIETHELSANLQCGLITLLQIEFGTSINERALYLVPSSSKHHPYRKAVSKL
jgi:RhoGEF domain